MRTLKRQLARALVLASVAVCSGHPRADAPDGRFVTVADGVQDQVTGLVWQQPDDGQKYTWVAAMTHCTMPFRLPTIEELATLLDVANTGVAVVDAAFTNADAAYWSSTPRAGDATQAWYIAFYQAGEIYDASITDSFRVRCVR
jgi:hypothetical protein